MEIDIGLNGESLPIQVDNPFHMDTERIVGQISAFLEPRGVETGSLHLLELLPRMVKGIVGCERGCPADAQSFVQKGFHDYALEYVEGGILKAVRKTAGGDRLEIRMFPDF